MIRKFRCLERDTARLTSLFPRPDNENPAFHVVYHGAMAYGTKKG